MRLGDIHRHAASEQSVSPGCGAVIGITMGQDGRFDLVEIDADVSGSVSGGARAQPKINEQVPGLSGSVVKADHRGVATGSAAKDMKVEGRGHVCGSG